MITDLLRNDLGIVCEIGTVARAAADGGRDATRPCISSSRPSAGGCATDARRRDCIRACFPGGSMTGAPKKRTMEIIDKLEAGPRGVYSGAIGYFGARRRRRPEHRDPHDRRDRRRARRRIGAGGAIVVQSDPEEEYEEILLKGRAPMQAIRLAASGGARRDHRGRARQDRRPGGEREHGEVMSTHRSVQEQSPADDGQPAPRRRRARSPSCSRSPPRASAATPPWSAATSASATTSSPSGSPAWPTASPASATRNPQ